MSQRQRSDDAEERRIEKMFSLVRENVFGADAEKNRQKQKIVIVRIIQQQRDRHATDVGTQRNNPFTLAEKPMKKHLEQTAGHNGQQNLQRAAIKAQDRATENGIESQEGGERDSGIRPGGKHPLGSRPHFFRSGCLQSSGELQRDAHIWYESFGLVVHNAWTASNFSVPVSKVKRSHVRSE